MTNRTKREVLAAYQSGLEFFTTHGYKPTFQRLDNEISTDFHKYLTVNDIIVDLVSPGQYRRNIAERVIRT